MVDIYEVINAVHGRGRPAACREWSRPAPIIVENLTEPMYVLREGCQPKIGKRTSNVEFMGSVVFKKS